MTAVVIIEAVVIVMLLILVAGLLKSHAEILRRLDRLGAAADSADHESPQQPRTSGLGRAPTDEIIGIEPGGSAVSASLSPRTGETLLAFLSTGCASCQVFWEEFATHPALLATDARPIIVTKGSGAESPPKVAQLAPPEIRVVMSDEAWDEFKVPLTPYFMLVGGDGGIIGEGSATNMDRLLDLLRGSADDSPVRMSTRQRERFTDDRLSSSGVEPGDPSLYEDPLR
ncbi:MAG TPA: hypothetical protein VK969_01225 [Acidimicrobiia bacterium]|nr:hypothetical protein [Acidimicrobiia bacterium]